MKLRIGIGYDVHKLDKNEEFWLGGIKIDHYKGSIGHSDGDALLHSICDALFGAANLQDIGYHFSNTSKKYQGIDSKFLLKEALKKIATKGFTIENIDTTICLEKPKIQTLIPQMKKTIAHILNMDIDDISIKATTTEKMGFVGNEQGISVYAVVLLKKE